MAIWQNSTKQQRQKETKNLSNNQKIINNIRGAKPHISININLDINGLNAPLKKYRLAEWIGKKNDLTICCLQKIHFTCKDIYGLKVKWRKTIFRADRKQK